jgi:hypothetical protein
MVKLDLIDDFDKGVMLIKRSMDSLKRSVEPFATYYFFQLAVLVP